MFYYSVVIPAHNEAARIAVAIESVLAQSVCAREVLVVDDGSEDGTGGVAGRYPAVRIIRHEQCQGLSEARNSGIAASTCEWVAFLDADDSWDPCKIEKQFEVAALSGAGLIYCGKRVQWDGQDRPEECPASVWRNHRALCRGLLLANCVTGSGSGVLVRRDLLNRVGGFDPALRVAEDWDMWIRLAQVTQFAAVRDPLVTLTARAGSLGGDPQRMFEGARRVLEKHDNLFREYWDGWQLRRRAKARLHERLGIGYLMKGQRKAARNCFLRAAMIWPFRLHTIVPLTKLLVGAI